MMLLVIASAFLLAVCGQAPDPAKSCLPDVHQTTFASLNHDIRGVVAFDFPNKIISTRYDGGLRVVFDLNDASVASINETDSSCSKNQLPEGVKNLVSQCLPANATLLGPGATRLGLAPGLPIHAWEYTVPSLGTIRLAVTTTTPAVVVLGQNTAADASTSDIQIFLNPSTTISDPTIFDVPDDCPVNTVVG
jgi:hypothetical protein